MRNLKKVLSLVLAMAMMLSVMVVGAGAAFTDEDEFSAEYVTAAEVLTNIGVLKGYEDGSFQPQDTITRAETAALIYRMATGDVADAQTGIYTQMTNGFTDVPNGKWFAGYINFCANAQYILGMGDGTFGPQKNVTGYQTLAMILRAAGFDKDGEFAGPNWEVKTASFAEKLGVLDNVKATEDLGAPASRELVAQLLFAVMTKVELVHYAPFYGYVPVEGNETLGEKQFELTEVNGVIWENEMAALTNADKALDAGKTTIIGVAGRDEASFRGTINLSTDLDIIGEQVSVWVVGEDMDAVSTPVSLADTTTEWSNTTISKLSDTAEEAWEDAIEGHAFYNDYDKTSSPNTGLGIYVKVIDNPDGKDFVLTEKSKMDCVDYVKSNGDVKLSSALLDADNLVAYTGIAADDVVLYIEIDGTTYVEKAAYVTGAIDTFKTATSSADAYVTVGGETYKESVTAPAASSDCVEDFNIEILPTTFMDDYNGKYFNFYQDAFGNFVAYAEAGENAVEYGMILDYDVVANGAFEGQLTIRPEDGLNKGDLWVKYLTEAGEVEIAKVDLKDGDFSGNIKAGDVVKYRVNDEGKFVVVYDIAYTPVLMGTVPSWGYAYALDIDFDENQEVSLVDALKYEFADDMVAFYYYTIPAAHPGNDEVIYDAIYGVMTAEEAMADLELLDKTNVDFFKPIKQMDADAGVIDMLNINAPVDMFTGFAYIDDFANGVGGSKDADGDPVFTYEAIDENGDPIELTSYVDLSQAGLEGPVFGYVTSVYGVNYLVEVEDLGFKLIEGDLHAHNDALFFVNNALDGLNGGEYDLYLATPAVYALAAGGTTELSKTACAYGYVVAFDVEIDGASVALETPAVFVTDAADGDEFYVCPLCGDDEDHAHDTDEGSTIIPGLM